MASSSPPHAKGPQLDVVVVAAGASSRMGGVDKVFAPLLERPILTYCLDAFDASDHVRGLCLVLNEANRAKGEDLVEGGRWQKLIAVATGGARRQDSVRMGLEALAGRLDPAPLVAIHDGARPFVNGEMIEAGVRAAKRWGAAVPGVPVADTLKSVSQDNLVKATPHRAGLRAVQTPQVFRADLLLEAHRRVPGDVTDDAMMVERIGGTVGVFPGDPENLKITTSRDLANAREVASTRFPDRALPRPGEFPRWGTGFDGHRLAPGIPLRLGGVTVPFEMGLEGHSDGDALLHAVASALLGAAGLGDLGTHFPSADPALAGIDSREIVSRTVAKARECGWLVSYVDATIIAQRPKLSSFLDAMQTAVAGSLGITRDRVNIKVTSTDHVGAIGRGEGIAAQAIASLVPG